jgi:hypothetical protein
MAKQYFVRLLIRNQRDDLVFEVREAESDHLAVRLAEHSELDEPDFCWFQSVEGKSVIVNLADIQAARFFWEAADGPSNRDPAARPEEAAGGVRRGCGPDPRPVRLS